VDAEVDRRTAELVQIAGEADQTGAESWAEINEPERE
jgi:hypothetical protein